MKRGRALAILLAFACCAWPAFADHCSVNVSVISFGSYSATEIDVTGLIKVKCSGNVSTYQVGIDAGTGSGATVTNRSMTDPSSSAQLGYQLFRDPGHVLNWGNTPGVDTVPNNTQDTYTVYARLPANQYSAPADPNNNYIDTVTVTVTEAGNTFTGSFQITAMVQNYCIISASSLNFGVYSGTLTNSASTISVTCTNTTPYSVGLDAGTAAGATVTNRSMTGPNSMLLSYKLFRDSNHSQNWGNTVGVDTVSRTGTGLAQSLTVYGQVPAGQTGLPPGDYSDTITATITY